MSVFIVRKHPVAPLAPSPGMFRFAKPALADNAERVSIGIPSRLPVTCFTDFYRRGAITSSRYEIQLVDLFYQMRCELLHGRRRRVAQVGKRQER